MKKRLPKAIKRSADRAAEAVIQPSPEPQPTPPPLDLAPAEPSSTVGYAIAEVNSPPAAASLSEADRHEALKLVERFAFWAGAAGAIPVPGVDLAGVAAVQVQMVRRLAEMFDVEFSRDRGKAVVAAVGGAVITGSSGLGAASLTKTVPVLGPAVSAIAVPTLAAGATFAIGIAFLEHFATGGTLLNFDLQKLRQTVRAK